MAARGEIAGQEVLFPPFRLDPGNERLERDGRAITLRPKAFAVLKYLAVRPGQLVPKQELLDTVWRGTFVSDTVVKVCVREIRQALSDDPRRPRYLETVSRRGYRFIGSVADRAVSAAGGTTMVGRREELRRLQGVLALAREGHRRLVFVTGEPGIGKTTLIGAFLERLAKASDLRLATGQCLEFYGSGEAYMPVLETLNRLCQGAHGAQVVDLLRSRAPSWLVQMPWLVSAADQEDLQRRTRGLGSLRMLREMVETLEALSALTPLVLVLEDLHWSDGSTLDLLSALARRPEAGRLMILGTFRPTELDAGHPLAGLWQDLRLHGLCEELALELLTPAEVEEYVERRLSTSGKIVPPGLAELVMFRTDGHPLFVVHLTDHLASVIPPNAEPQLDDLLESGELTVPANLRQLIEGLVYRLSPEEQRLLEAASVAGVRFSAATVATALGTSVAEVEGRAEEIVRRGEFLRSAGTVEWPDGTLAGRYKFVHTLYQSVLYKRLTQTTRIRLHQRIGAVLAEGFGAGAQEIAGEVAMHFERGHDFERAVKYREQAAQTAIRRSADNEAIDHLKRGLELLAALPADAARSAWELALQKALEELTEGNDG